MLKGYVLKLDDVYYCGLYRGMDIETGTYQEATVFDSEEAIMKEVHYYRGDEGNWLEEEIFTNFRKVEICTVLRSSEEFEG